MKMSKKEIEFQMQKAEEGIKRAREKYPNPPCQSHPDRVSIAFYKTDGGIRGLCLECWDRKQQSKRLNEDELE